MEEDDLLMRSTKKGIEDQKEKGSGDCDTIKFPSPFIFLHV